MPGKHPPKTLLNCIWVEAQIKHLKIEYKQDTKFDGDTMPFFGLDYKNGCRKPLKTVYK